jgi:hypothetical protein
MQEVAAWGKPSLAKTLLRPVITLTSYRLGHQAKADNFPVSTLDLALKCLTIVLFRECKAV